MTTRRAFRHHLGKATFYADTLFLCLESDDADSFVRLIAEMPRDIVAAERALRTGQREQVLPVLSRHCHEFVHYHQFAGSRFGLVFRRLLAAKTRLREQILLQLEPGALHALLNSNTGHGPLMRIESAHRIAVHPIVRANADADFVAVLGWLDAFEAHLLDGSYPELFTPAARTAAILDATAEWTREGGDFAPVDLLIKLEAEPDTEPDQTPKLSGISSICEAQATINERPMLERQAGDPLALSLQAWIASSYWDIPRRFHVKDTNTSKGFALLAACVLLVTDIALNGVPPDSGGGSGVGLIVHPSRVVSMLIEMQDRWRHIVDSPLQHWSRADFLQRRADIVSLGLNNSLLPRFAVPEPETASGQRRDAHPVIQQLGIYAELRSLIAYVNNTDPAAALFPTGCILERPDAFVMDDRLLKNLVCPFLAVGGVPFRNRIDEETWVRWRLLCGYELWLDNIFCGRKEEWSRLAAGTELIQAIRELGINRAGRAV